MAAADSGQRAFGDECHPGAQLPDCRGKSGVYATKRKSPARADNQRSCQTGSLRERWFDRLDSRFPGNVIPANLIDQNAVLQLNAGTFPKPNFNNGTQYIASIPQPTNVREDIVRIDHAINSKYQLMGHYLHDTLAQNYFPPLWGDSSYPTVGTAMNNPSYLGGDQADPDILA